jgi:Ser/Thr protein kinase RdoA (MazF antagonist)
MSYTSTPRIDETTAKAILRERFSITTTTGSLPSLPSERDQNFLVHDAASGCKYVLKIAHESEEVDLLVAQNQCLQFLATSGLSCVPHVVTPTSGSHSTCVITDFPGCAHPVRLITYLAGTPLQSCPTRDATLFSGLGKLMGNMDRTLEKFDHSALHRVDFQWDLRNYDAVVEKYLPTITSESHRKDVEKLFRLAKSLVAPVQHSFSCSVIHNDWNTGNVLVHPAGVIDFGDMAYTWCIANPAILVAYSLLDLENPLTQTHALVDAIVRGYVLERLLSAVERDAILPLACIRLCTSAVIMASQMAANPLNQHLSSYLAPVVRTIPPLITLLEHVHQSAALILRRSAALGTHMRLFYDPSPVHLVRGKGVELFDIAGKSYLDCYNNVVTIGHCHERVSAALIEQAQILNTNTRYLTEESVQYAERLLATVHPSLDRVLFVNSGSEANDIAYRIAKVWTGKTGALAIEVAYHGITVQQKCLITLNLSSLSKVSSFRMLLLE